MKIPNTEDIPEIFDRKKLAEILGVSEWKARDMMRSPEFPVRYVSPRKPRIFKKEFLMWLSNHNEFHEGGKETP